MLLFRSTGRTILVLCYVGKVGEVVGILTGPVDVADVVLADRLLGGRIEELDATQRDGQHDLCPFLLLTFLFRVLPLQLLNGPFRRLGPADVTHQS